MDPALRSFDPAHLDTGQSLIQFLGDRSHLGHAAGQADFFAVVNDLAYRGDHCCGTAQTSLCEVFYFIQVYFSLFYFCLLYTSHLNLICRAWPDRMEIYHDARK